MVMLTREEEAGKVRKRAGLGLVAPISSEKAWLVTVTKVELNASALDMTIAQRLNKGLIVLL